MITLEQAYSPIDWETKKRTDVCRNCHYSRMSETPYSKEWYCVKRGYRKEVRYDTNGHPTSISHFIDNIDEEFCEHWKIDYEKYNCAECVHATFSMLGTSTNPLIKGTCALGRGERTDNIQQGWVACTHFELKYDKPRSGI